MNHYLLLAAFFLPQPGLYTCQIGNEPSICDQEIKVHGDSTISVVYEGDCAGQGPYLYSCENNRCQDDMGMITFEFKDDNHYRWENKQYGFFCDFSL